MGEFAEYYQNGGVFMHLVLLGGMAGLAAGLAAAAARKRVLGIVAVLIAAAIVGVGAVAGRLLMSTTISVSSNRTSAPTGAHLDVDARRVATKVTRELSRFFSEQGWTGRWAGS